MLDFNIGWQLFANQPTNIITPIGTESSYVEMSITVVPDWNKSVYLEWDPIEPPEDAVGPPVFMIYYSESEFGPFTSITTQPISDTTYFTRWQEQDSKIYEQFFTVESIYFDASGDRLPLYRSYPRIPSLGLPKWHILRSKDIIRREAILLDKFAGAPAIIRSRKRMGVRCPDCWDEVNEKVTDDHCKTCLGTSYKGGYDTGMRTKLQFSSMDSVSRMAYQGLEEPIRISAWGLPFPLLHPGNIILREGDRKVFRIDGHQGSTEMLTNVQRQNVVLTELGRDAIENELFNRSDVIDVMPRQPHVHH
jgi:hypothetical protein